MRVRKRIGQLHLWLGLTSGLVVFIVAITGCLFCFEKELKDLCYKDRIFVDERKPRAIALDSLNAIVKASLPAGQLLDRIEIQPGSARTYIYSAYSDSADNSVYINPYTGKVQYVQDNKREFFSLVLGLHYELLLGEAGQLIVRWATVVFVLMLITGIVLWWPKNKAAARQRVWFKWKRTTGWKRKNYDLHNIPGFYSLFIVLFIALSGLVFGFEWARSALTYVANGGKKVEEPKPVFSDTLQTKATINFQDVYDRILKQETEAKKILFVFPGDKEGTISVRSYYSAENFVKQNTLFFDQYSGTLLQTRAYKDLSNGRKAGMGNYDVHVGKIVGLPGQILAFIGSLIAASLPVTGFIIWLGRKKKKQGKASYGYASLGSPRVKFK